MMNAVRRAKRNLPECAGLDCARLVGDGRPPAVILHRDRVTLLCGHCAEVVALGIPFLGTAGGDLNGLQCFMRVFSLDVIDPEILPRA